MHEWSICKSIIQLIEQQDDVKNYTNVLTITLSIGQLTCIDADSLVFNFKLASRSQLFKDSELIIQTIPAIAKCRPCGLKFETDKLVCHCPKCNSLDTELFQGNELLIQSIEVN